MANLRETIQRPVFVYAMLALLIFAVFGRSLSYRFVNFDDPHYIINNYSLHDGLTLAAIRWAFSTGYAENWHPLTWLSHMLDFQMFGMNPNAFRLTNILFHVASACVLFAALLRMTRAFGPSAAVAVLFAIHPLHVESVVWLAERKDVLSGLFWMLTLYAYARYTERPSVVRYIWVSLALALGLMAKSMLVTLPCVLILLDFWPLNRFSSGPGEVRRAWMLIAEKAPLIALSAAFSAITMLVQTTGGTVKTFESLPLAVRVANAVVAYGAYLWKTVWPFDLAVLYPLTGTPPGSLVAIVGLLLAGTTIAAFRFRTRAPYAFVGWLWFTGTLVPVIGIVQVGDQAYADRYTYIPLVGLFIACAWGAAERFPVATFRLAAPICTAAFTMLAALSWNQVGYWRDSVTLFKHCVVVTGDNAPARNNLGSAYQNAKLLENAEHEFRESLRILPGYFAARNNLALLLLERGAASEAELHFAALAAERPSDPRLLLNRGIAEAMQGRLEAAEASIRRSLELDAKYLPTRFNLAIVLEKAGRLEEAKAQLRNLLELAPDYAPAHDVLARISRVDSAVGQKK